MPTPLSFKRNGDNINDKHDRMSVPDEDKGGKYFGASLRMGPFMTVQEDRVSKNLLYFGFLPTIFLKFTFKEKFQGSDINAFYAVFDGHQGYHASHFC